MEYKSLFRTSFDVLRKSRWAWLFGFLSSVAVTLPSILNLIHNLAIVLCFTEIAWFFLLIASPLGLTISLYYDYLARPLALGVVLKEIKKYFIRWTGLILLLYFPFLLLGGYFISLASEINYLVVLLVTLIPYHFFVGFLLCYIFLTMLRSNFGIWQAAKFGSKLWINRLDIKLGIAVMLSTAGLMFFFLRVLFQNQSVLAAFTINYHASLAFQSSASSLTAALIYSWIVAPIDVAVVISMYFRDINDNTMRQSVPQ